MEEIVERQAAKIAAKLEHKQHLLKTSTVAWKRGNHS
jgi:hypothetical protein